MITRTEPPWAELDDGIRETVRALWLAGFAPTDSGDGNSKAGMECALAVPHVFMRCDPQDLVADARRLQTIVDSWATYGRWRDAASDGPSVQACYLPRGDAAVLELYGALR